MRIVCLVAVIAVGSVMGVASCSSGGSTFQDGPLGAPDAGPSGVFSPDGAAEIASCSGDLRTVVDSAGRVLATCAGDQVCSEGKCIPACESVEKTKSTVGCNFYVAQPDILPPGQGACFAAFVANTWGAPVKLSVDRAGQTLDVEGMTRIPSGSGQAITYAPLVDAEIPAGQVAIVFLSRNGKALTNCPEGVTPGFTSALGSVTGTGRGEAFHLKTSAPVVAYDIYPYGGGASAMTSATLLLPTNAWDVNYVGVNAYRKSTRIAGSQPFLQIVAQEDGTEVKILPSADIVGGDGVIPTGAHQIGVYRLDRGQLLQLTQDEELTGSAIEADKPIGVFGGSTCLTISVGVYACDSAHQQLPPVRALGSRYVGVRYRNRFDEIEEAPPWRIVGAVDGTTLTYEPSAPAGAPTTLGFGQVVEFSTGTPFVVRSQDDAHPFYISGHMTGWTAVSDADSRGDPEFVNVIPPEQYQRSYVFFTDPTYPETNLVVVRQKSNGVFSDVKLDCAGTLTGWQPIDASGEFEFTRFDLVRGSFEKQGNCDNGRHEMTSEAPFGLTVWGWGSAASDPFQSRAVSYAYPAGAGVKPVNNVVVPAKLR